MATTPAGGNGVDPEKEQQAEQSAKRLLDEGATTDAPSKKPEDLQWLTEKLQAQDIKHKDAYAKQELELRQTYAGWLLLLLALQLVLANVIFWVYAEVGEHWKLPDGVIQIWLGATVVQMVGIVTVVTVHLFPKRDGATKTPKSPGP